MHRRLFIRALGASCVLAKSLTAHAQGKARMRRIGYLSPGTPFALEDEKRALRKLGWIDGENFVIEPRFANGKIDALPALAEELVRRKVDMIVTDGTPATLAAKSATSTIPIVFWSTGDPVRAGLVASLGKPGGNVTGCTTNAPAIDGKRLQVLHDLVPSIRRVGVLENPANPYFRAARENTAEAARSLGMESIFVELRAAKDVPEAVAEVVRRGGQGLLVGPDDLFGENQAALMRAALSFSLPTTVSRLYIRETGALISYAPTEAEHDTRAAALIDRVLRGARPADLPIEQPSRFALIINLRTARAIGVTVPQSMLLRADEVIE
jgi:putative ABC transport system substrate-binding protein